MRRRPVILWLAAGAVAFAALATLWASSGQPRSHAPPPPVPVPTSTPTRPAPPVADPWTPLPAALPLAPRTATRVTVPRSWQQLPDISAAFAQLLGRLPDGTELTFPPGDYRVHVSLLVQGRHDITLTGPASGPPARLLQTGDGHDAPSPHVRSVIDFQHDARVAARHLTIIGANPRGEHTDYRHNPYEGQAGVATSRGSDTTLSDLDIRSTYGDGIYLGWQARRALAERNHVSHTGRQGITATDTTDATIRGNLVDDVTIQTIDIEPNVALARVLVVGNRMWGKGAGINVNGPSLSDVHLSANRSTGSLLARVEARPTAGPGFARFTRVRVDGNEGGTGTDPGVAAEPEIRVDDVDYLTVVGNRSAQRLPRLAVSGSCPAILRDNTSTSGRAFLTVLRPEDATGNIATGLASGTLASDRLDPTPAISLAHRRLLGRPPTAAEQQLWASRLCRGLATTPTVLGQLLGNLDPTLRARAVAATVAPIVLLRAPTGAQVPATADDELAALTAILSDPASRATEPFRTDDGLTRLRRAASTAAGALAPLDTTTAGPAAPRRRAAAVVLAVGAAPPTSPLGAVRDVNLATLATRGRVATVPELVRWVPVLEAGTLDRQGLIGVLLATPPGSTSPTPCDRAPTDRRLVTLFGGTVSLGPLPVSC